jgi:sporulation protein YlmC with PRC-barrel domain
MLLRHRDIGPLLQIRESPMANNDMDRVVPLGQLDDYRVAQDDPDVRGWEVLASDGRKIGEVDELLVDTNAMKVRYLDVDVDDGLLGDGMDRHVLIPIGYARLEQERDCVMVDGLASADLQGLPSYDQGPLTRDFESSVRDSFSGRRTSPDTTAAGLTGAGAGMMDTAGLDNTPGIGTGMGMTGTTTGAGLSDAGTGMRADTHHLGDNVPTGEGMRAAGYDLDRGTPSPLSTGPGLSDTGSMRTGADLGASGGGTSGGSISSEGTSAGADDTLVGGMSAGAGSQGPVSGMGTDRGPQGDMSHRASSGAAGSDYLHNADEDFYASDAFDDSRFYGARRGGTSASPGGVGEGMGADRDETARLAREASERLREDERNRGVGGSGGL